MDSRYASVIDNVAGRLMDASKHVVTLMPDFFIDRIVVFEGSFDELVSVLRDVAERGGGNYIVREEISRGGNAANTASAIASIGVRVNLIVVTSELGKLLLSYFMKDLPVSLDHVKVAESESKTVALEFHYKGRKVNVMLSDPGSLKCFDLSMLSREDIESIEASNLVGVFNWNQNDCSNKLLRELRENTSKPLFLDTSDPRIAGSNKVLELVEMLKKGVVDYLSLNENEAVYYANRLGYSTDDPVKAAKYLSRELGVKNIYLHTPKITAVFPQEVIIKTIPIKPLRVTGAGDTWNAGIIAGIILGLNPLEQLVLANTMSACYLVNKEPRHCTIREILQFTHSELFKNLPTDKGR